MRKRGRKKPLFGKFTITLCLIGIFGFFAVSAVGKRELSTPHKILFEVLGTAQAGVSGIFGFFQDTWTDYIALWGVRAENERLRAKLKEYQASNIQFREAVTTNIKLAKMLELKKNLPRLSLTASIIGRDPSQWFKTFSINRGSNDGVSRGMPVITVEGVVGQVFDGSFNYSKVIQANDPNCAIDVLVQRTRVQGMMKGNGSGCQLHYVNRGADVKVGDQIVTSGLSGVFPKGIPAGQVKKVVSSKRGMFLNITIQPAVEFNRIEQVIIVMKSNQLTE